MKPLYLKPYKYPANYLGPSYEGYYPFLGRSRDSDCLEQSNFRSGLAAIGGESETVLVIRDSHWAIGWVETIYIHESDEKALDEADRIAGDLKDYPVVDEEDWSNLEWETAAEYWERMRVSDRIEAIERSGSDASIFSARRPEMPPDSGHIQEYLLGA